MNRIFIKVLLALIIVFNVALINDATAGNEDDESGVIHLDKQAFKDQVFDFEKGNEWKYKGEVPAILDFYADWCGPCRMVAPLLINIQKEYKGKVQVFKVNTDKEKELATIFGIRSLPTIVFIPKDGKPQAILGYRPQEELEKMISEVLKVTK